MQILTLIFQVILAIPKIFSLVKEFISMLIEIKAKKNFDEAMKRNDEVLRKIEESKTEDEKKAALEEAAKLWGSRGKK